MPSFVFANFLETELLDDISAEASIVHIPVAMSAKLPIISEVTEARLVLWDGINSPEIISVIENFQSGYLTVQRAREGTSSRPWPTGTQVICTLTAEVINAALQAYYDIGALLSANYLKLLGGTLTGPLILSGNPTTALGAATKQYADSVLGAKLPLSGGTMLGPINMNGQRILNLPPAVSATEPARKGEVDSGLSSAVATLNTTITDQHAAIEGDITALHTVLSSDINAVSLNVGVVATNLATATTNQATVNRNEAGVLSSSGTSTAYIVSTIPPFASLAAMANQKISFVPFTTNGDIVTLNVDGLGPKPVRASVFSAAELNAGILIQGTRYNVTYDNVNGLFLLHDLFGNPGSVPVGAGMDFWGSVTPSSNYAFAMGQSLSTASYPELFALIGYTYGGAGGAFNLPDKSGRVSVGRESTSIRLTATYFGGNSTNLGAVGGLESNTLATVNLPAYTPSGGVGANINNANTQFLQGGASDNFTSTAGSGQFDNLLKTTPTIAATFTGNPQGGTSTPFRTVQPSIICNYIIRVK